MTIPHLEDYQDLMRRTQVPPKATQWYVKRVAAFLDSRDEPDAPSQDEVVDSFIEGLGRELEDWQVTQARDAIRLYRYLLDEEERSSRKMAGKASDDHDGEWIELAEETVRVLRLKHRSYRTEQTYMKWLGRFRHFRAGTPPKAIESQEDE